MSAIYFTYKELVDSPTARSNKIDNNPDSWSTIENLQRLSLVLDQIRISFGKAIKVNSGYRSPQLNKLVGGSSTSVHQIGLGADITPYKFSKGSFDELVKLLETKFLSELDQIIVHEEKNYCHIGLSSNKDRHQIIHCK